MWGDDVGPNDESCVGEVVFGDYLCDTGAGACVSLCVIELLAVAAHTRHALYCKDIHLGTHKFTHTHAHNTHRHR